jgi:hypothetical protein
LALSPAGSARRTESGNEMWPRNVDKFTGRDDLCILPEVQEMLTIAADQKVGASGVGALDKHVVVRIAGHLDLARRND